LAELFLYGTPYCITFSRGGVFGTTWASSSSSQDLFFHKRKKKKKIATFQTEIARKFCILIGG